VESEKIASESPSVPLLTVISVTRVLVRSPICATSWLTWRNVPLFSTRLRICGV